VASLSQGRTAAAQCGLFTYKSVPVIFEPPCTTDVTTLASITKNIYMFLNQLITETWERLLAIMGIHEAELHRRTAPRKVHSLNDLAQICLMCNLCALEPCQCQEMCAVKWMMYNFLVWPDRPKCEARELTEIQPFAINRCFNTNVSLRISQKGRAANNKTWQHSANRRHSVLP